MYLRREGTECWLLARVLSRRSPLGDDRLGVAENGGEFCGALYRRSYRREAGERTGSNGQLGQGGLQLGTGRTRVGTTNARALIPLSAREVTRWLQPWPIQLRGGRFHLEIVPISRCERFYAFWRTGPRSEYRTIAWWAKDRK